MVAEEVMLPLPEIDQDQVTPLGPVKLALALAHIELTPVIEHVGSAFTVTAFVQTGLLEHPLASVVVRVKVKMPVAVPALTVTDWAVVEPTMVPLVPIDQL